MYTYCLNNPVNMNDSNGNIPDWLKALALVAGSIAAAAKIAGNHRRNSENKKRINKEIKSSYTIPEAEEEINEILKTWGDDCKVTFNDNAFHIENSYRVDSVYVRQKICAIVNNTGLTNRTVGNESAEWVGHNEYYWLVPDGFIYKENAKHVDIEFVKDERVLVEYASRFLELIGVG